MYRSTKSFYHLPCAHRQWRDDGHCQFVHGYDRSIHMVFQCTALDDKMWVMDFGGLKQVKAWLEDLFDHTLLINEDDPEKAFFEDMDKRGLCKLRIMPNIGMEGSAKYVFDYMEKWLLKETAGRVQIYSVECRENEKNSAVYLREENTGYA
jgi:6-pyruvoyltetrahydropterin/6-carboxytetrahydropterin synthase